MGVLKVWDGTTWQMISANSDGASVFVGPDPPPGAPDKGDMWFDEDEDGVTGTTLPLTVANGGTGATSAAVARTNLGINLPLGLADGGTGGTTAAAARSSLAVPAVGQSGFTAGAPTTGTWTRGDQWLDSTNVMWMCLTAGTPGTWTKVGGLGLLAYAEGQSGQSGIGGTAAVLTGSTTPTVTLTSSRRIEMRGSACFAAAGGAAAMVLMSVGDSTDTYINHTVGTAPISGFCTLECSRVLTIPAGTYSFRLRGWTAGGTFNMYGNTYLYTKITDMGPP